SRRQPRAPLFPYTTLFRSNTVDEHGCRTRSDGSRVGRVFGLGVRGERITHAGNRFAVDQDIGGAGNNRRGWESLVICTQVTQQHNFLAHSFAPSFPEESSIDFRGRHWHHTPYGKQRLTKTQPKNWQAIQTISCL